MSIRSKLARLPQAVDPEKLQKSTLTRYLEQDKIKQLLNDAKALEKNQVVIDTNEEYQVLLYNDRLEVYESEVEPLGVRPVDKSFRFFRTWSSEATFSVRLKSDKIKVEYAKPIGQAGEVIANLEYLLFDKTY